MLFLEQYAIEELRPILRIISVLMQTRRKYRDAEDEFTLGMF